MTRLMPLLASLGVASAAGPTKFIYLMMENRAFDHMLGFLPGVNGLKGNETIPLNPLDPSSPKFTVTNTSAFIDPDPGHSVQDTTVQLFGQWQNYDPTKPAPMDGFIANAMTIMGQNQAEAVQVIHAFAPSHVPIISTLAQEFTLVDGYYSSVPGPTYINRLYAISATSQGWGQNDLNQTIRGWSQRSIFKALSDANVDWRVYMEEASTAFLMQDMRTLSAIEKMKNTNQFYADAAAGNLPPFSFIDPAYFTIPSIVNASDQHPSHDVLDGERLIKKIYEALRASPDWENSILCLTYDEHGGFYDHVSPPSGVPNPDGLPCNDCDMPFNFDRLGVRVPFLVISPWVQKGQVISEAPAHVKPYPTSQMEHSSLSATLHRLFPNMTGPGPNNFLTKRDAWAAPFDFIWTESGITTPRTDCPMTLPDVPVGGYFATPEGQKKLDGTAPLTPLQREWLHMMHGTLLDGKVTPADVDAMIDAQGLTTEAAAGLWIREMTEMKLKKAASVKH